MITDVNSEDAGPADLLRALGETAQLDDVEASLLEVTLPRSYGEQVEDAGGISPVVEKPDGPSADVYAVTR
jgi:hypothetical protein